MTRKSMISYAVTLSILSMTGQSAALADSASCLSECTKAYAECRKTAVSTNDFANCLQQRKECIESCGNASD